jgi:hypothetical protein
MERNGVLQLYHYRKFRTVERSLRSNGEAYLTHPKTNVADDFPAEA